MKILDYYILKKYLGAFFYMVFAFILVICVIDFTDKNDEFIENKVPFWEIIFDYYFNLIPYLANFLSPLMVFLSTIFVTAKLAAHTEIVAMLSSGVSFWRILRPYFFGALMLGGLTFYLMGWLIPRANEDRINFELTYTEDPKEFDGKNIHYRLQYDLYAYVHTYNSNTDIGRLFTLERIKDKQIVERLTSNRIMWIDSLEKWRLDPYTIRTFDGEKETLSYHDKTDTILDLFPRDFEVEYKVHEKLTIPQMKAHIEEMELRGKPNIDFYRIQYYERFTYPFAIIILSMIGVVVSARKSREGVGMQLIVGFILAFCYFAVLQLGRNFAEDRSIHPLMSAWIPNIVFLILGYILYRKLPK